MDLGVKLKQVTLLLGDVLILYASLAITLFIRYSGLSREAVDVHFWPFTFIFGIWLTTFYIGGLYDLKSLKNDLDFYKKFITLLVVNGVLATLLFYFIPAFGITPKTNLFTAIIIFGLANYIWRTLYNTFLSTGAPENRVLMIGYNKTVEDVVGHIAKNPQLGYETKFWMKEGLQDKEFEHLAQIILANKINLIVVPAHIKKNSKAARLIYKNLILGIEVLDLSELYEKVFQKLPLAELEEVWFLENLAKSHKIYEFIKRPIEIFLASLMALALLPLGLLLGLFVYITSRGPAIFRQNRSGRNEREFMIFKFRTMKADAEKNGPQWAKPGDQRATLLGRILRATHLDELPQLLNIIRGDLSFVGPRPDRPEFVSHLKRDVPYFELRLLVRPGITGWAQINYKYGASVEDAYEKLQYDMYYLKNRSLTLDFIILLRTVKYLFTNLK
ncbi:MAG: exopolysaccharide biosynthesis polyprenyl glycosylphosphotransferase [bacterium]|nr:exopolysaccharide biosynthesis polyprenyl glycosylphosphotransferase [bacterium]